MVTTSITAPENDRMGTVFCISASRVASSSSPRSSSRKKRLRSSIVEATRASSSGGKARKRLTSRLSIVGKITFGGATFTGIAWFAGATFTHHAQFAGATFTPDARFDGAAGLERAELDGVRVAPAEGVTRSWPPGWRVEEAADGWQTLRLAAGAEGTGAAEGGPVPEPTPGPEG
jgi:hypothetical protein